ncbi:MAG: DUF393 domain-containing protein [Flavobacteriaceae bacterium]|nr:DUF393 domain-containing protein [Flavobacteriaceae bacterium]
MTETKNKSIILFDGICNLCNSSVQFILKHDHKKQFLFASLQSDAAAKLLLQLNSKNNKLSSILLIEDNKIYKKSTAALRISRELNPLFNWFYIFIIIPTKLRDFAYDIIAKNRYKWFGKRGSCLIDNAKYKERFITNG